MVDVNEFIMETKKPEEAAVTEAAVAEAIDTSTEALNDMSMESVATADTSAELGDISADGAPPTTAASNDADSALAAAAAAAAADESQRPENKIQNVGLATLCEKVLGKTLDKTEQVRSAWLRRQTSCRRCAFCSALTGHDGHCGHYR